MIRIFLPVARYRREVRIVKSLHQYFGWGGGTLSLGNVEATGVRTKPIRGRVESFITLLLV
jgi:hypothetical protein